jgi:hypothetical protein
VTIYLGSGSRGGESEGEGEKRGEREGGGGGLSFLRGLSIAPLLYTPCYCKKGPRIPILDLSRRPLTHVGSPGI